MHFNEDTHFRGKCQGAIFIFIEEKLKNTYFSALCSLAWQGVLEQSKGFTAQI